MTTSATYIGPHAAATVVLPDRSLVVVRGRSYEIEADEVEYLDAEAWDIAKAKPESKSKRQQATETEGA